ncbi:PWWP domain-containing MUM1L1-like protein [Labeo rohita]|uniref:PWWP domain-containing MUM1L1-like protein n=1 Tax=Labeo rohita TaxID=84645 RepID=A0A498MU10_LABRO|nr:PWWP domain-containing MUM1L1-like protein [Labeo rohita]
MEDGMDPPVYWRKFEADCHRTNDLGDRKWANEFRSKFIRHGLERNVLGRKPHFRADDVYGRPRPVAISFGLDHGECKWTESNRISSSQALVDFIVARKGTDYHIQSIIRGQKKSKWLDTFSKCSVKMVPVPVYIEDQEQIDLIYSHLSSILDSTTTHTHSDEIKFIMHVLFPEAEEKFLTGPAIDIRSVEVNGGRTEDSRNNPEEVETRRQSQRLMRNAAFESREPMSLRKDKQQTTGFKEIKMFPSCRAERR